VTGRSQRDYAAAGLIVIYTFLVVGVNALADIVYGLVVAGAARMTISINSPSRCHAVPAPALIRVFRANKLAAAGLVLLVAVLASLPPLPGLRADPAAEHG
jgi:hypothetical protein